ncbi:hypothetical protein GCM10009754_77850 [Amycolatopsis minnesotensis]|uniref:Uncharacterized protein n=1 Tax=Amycolatopsis minnesotensis TaxID=337894 RepID=A0ABN2SK91_9PSEU
MVAANAYPTAPTAADGRSPRAVAGFAVTVMEDSFVIGCAASVDQHRSVMPTHNSADIHWYSH